MSKKDQDRNRKAATPPTSEDPMSEGVARVVRGALIALTLVVAVILTINDLNSYDTWTHLATGRLMWEEGRIPDHEPYSYTQNCEMTLEDASPKYAVKQSAFDRDGRMVASAGEAFDAACKDRVRKAGLSLSEVRVRLEPPVRKLLSDARDAGGRVVLAKGTLLHEGPIETLRRSGITRVETTVPWVNHEWLFQVPAYLSYKWFGLPGPTIYKAAVLAIGFLIVLLTAYRRETHVIGLAAVFLAAITSYKRFYMRPEIFSIMFMAAWLYLIERHRRKPEGWSICVWLPVLMVVWINTHGYFILGVAIPLIYLLGEGLQAVLPMPRALTRTLRWKEGLIEGRAYGKLALATLLTLAATFVNPYGIDGARYPIDVLQQVADPTSVIRTVIGEMQPPFQFSFTYAVWFTWALLGASAAAFLLNVRRIKLSRLLLWAMSLIFMSKALRNMPFFGIPGAVYLAINVNESWDDTIAFLRERVVAGALFAFQYAVQAAFAVVLVYFILINLNDRFYVNDIASIRFGLGYSEDKFSMGAAEWVHDHMNEVKGPVFNAFGMGGLCMWKLYPEYETGSDGVTRAHYGIYPREETAPDGTKRPGWGGRRLFIDGRAEMYGGPFVKNYTRALDTRNTPELWKALDDRYRFGIVFLNWQASDTQELMRTLYADPNSTWALVYGDGVGYVFVRNIPENRAVIARARNVIENPRLTDLSETYARLSAAMPGLPPTREFVKVQDRLWSLSRILCADPRIADEARRVIDTPGSVPFDRRLEENGYDRLRIALTLVGSDDNSPRARYDGGLALLPARVIAPGEMMGVAGFANLAGTPELSEAVLVGLLDHVTDTAELRITLANVYQNHGENLLRLGGERNDTALRNQGVALLQRSLLHYREAERQMSNYPGLSLQLLRLYSMLGDTPNALRYLRKCLDTIYPTVSTTTMLASVCMQYNRYIEAIQQYEIALDQLPEHEEAPIHERIAVCWKQRSLQDRSPRFLDKALWHARRAVDLQPGSLQNWYTLGDVLMQYQRFVEAIQQYEIALDRLPDNEEAPIHERLAVCWMQRSQQERNPGFLDKALAHARRAVDLQPGSLQNWYTLGDVLTLNGRRDDAIAAYQQCLKIKPDFEAAQQRIQSLRNPAPPSPPRPSFPSPR